MGNKKWETMREQYREVPEVNGGCLEFTRATKGLVLLVMFVFSGFVLVLIYMLCKLWIQQETWWAGNSPTKMEVSMGKA